MSEKSDTGFAKGINTLWLSVDPAPEHFLYMRYICICCISMFAATVLLFITVLKK